MRGQAARSVSSWACPHSNQAAAAAIPPNINGPPGQACVLNTAARTGWFADPSSSGSIRVPEVDRRRGNREVLERIGSGVLKSVHVAIDETRDVSGQIWRHILV